MGTNDNMNTNATAAVLDAEMVRRAMQWDEDAFRKVYEVTYYRMLYIAKKYMKSDAAAEDVLQEAYIKIWENLPQLGKPEAYVSWASRIVANTALNELRKTQPMLFSEMTTEGADGSEMSFDVEDTYTPNQPELSFTDSEEQLIIREMIDSLSDEQRMCILMYYMEDLSVREIAETLGCSEGTVKSRLNYGRQNIKAKAEELQKKGYNFKGISAMAVLVLLLSREAARMWARPVVVSAASAAPAAAAATTAAGIQPVAGVGTQATGAGAQTAGAGTPAAGAAAPATGATAPPAGATAPAAGVAAQTAGAGAASKAGFLSTLAGKITIAAAGILVAGGIALAVVLMNKNKDEKPKLDAENVTEITTISTEQVTTAAVTGVATTEAATEPATEPVTKAATEAATESTVDTAYIDAYAEILEENKTEIENYQANAETHNQRQKVLEEKHLDGIEPHYRSTAAVAIIDTLGDETPELFILTDAARHEDYIEGKLSVYTMVDGYAVKLIDHEMYDTVAGARQLDKLYTSKSLDGFYWNINLHGETVEKISSQDGLISIESINVIEDETGHIESYVQIEKDGTSKKIKKSAYNKKKKKWEADFGSLIFDNTSKSKVIAKSYEDAVLELDELQQKQSSDKGSGKTEDADHKEGTAYLKKLSKNIKAGKFDGTQAEITVDNVKYAYADLNQDGSDELILEGGISGVITFPDGKAHEVLYCAGMIRDSYLVLSDGSIVYSSATAQSMSKTKYELSKDGRTVKELQSVVWDANGGEKEMEDFNNSLPKEMKLKYKKLSKLK